ncbi:AmmeMemoRadiSam system protein A [candidate division KSB1 bacterium]
MFTLTVEEKQHLLKIARNAIGENVIGEKIPVEEMAAEIMRTPCGAFVTIRNKGDLRGCIGYIVASKPLIMTVREMAVSAATNDPRFSPLTESELSEIDIEISVLSPFRTIADVSEITVGEHGLLIKKAPYQGLLLPQVATEYEWNREQFLENTCLKAGLPSNAWKDKDTEIQIFSAVVFGEEDFR